MFINEQLSKEEYTARIKEIYPLTDEKIKEYEARAYKLSLKIPRKYSQISKCEGCSGDFLTNCRDCLECYDCYEDEHYKYVWNAPKNNKFCYDCTGINTGELILECVASAVGSYNVGYGVLCWMNDFNLRYCYYCIGSKNLFGCAGIKRAEYAILNKKYSKEEYEKMVPRIIEHMKKTGEWGEFFPIKHSPYPYNDTIAQEYFPITSAEALTKGYKWHEETPQELDKSADAKICAECNKQYKFIPQELSFYKTLGLPEPKFCYNCRYQHRFLRKNPKQLWERDCAKCEAKILTTYSPERPEIVYCDKCYTKMLY
ncbi:hypothetical protein HZA39_00535 [Candidatus Peregrinibacteria bacterium]|nr:hypothetical protein [Candidatus Peregrinibacteria bacterium]